MHSEDTSRFPLELLKLQIRKNVNVSSKTTMEMAFKLDLNEWNYAILLFRYFGSARKKSFIILKSTDAFQLRFI